MSPVVASGEFGAAKPDPRIFTAACEAAGVAAAEAMYVGDRLRTDVIGACRAGLVGVWIDRLHTATIAERTEASAAAAHVIHSLGELPPLAGVQNS
ncbi:HAD family hydrolase [Galbitalea sp. SE-J8]|uniref:HAD family hydrolase n=1 Tax=Galbitalea sp. SE-J8 TaxID=3054952 RepID=UPI00259CC4D8|nr:HAD family hydrolase [Galbitalea sp. SE-J8]MDM4763633.1 HAD family hydrolase [Galbitalea sp. SE-J8]